MAVSDRQAFAARIRLLGERVGSANQLAKQAGISRRILGDYLSGKSDPSREKLLALADAGGVSVEWLATGRTIALAQSHIDGGSTSLKRTAVFLPVLSRASSSQSDRHLPIPRPVAQELGADDTTAALVEIVDDAMFPTLQRHDLAIVRLDYVTPPPDGIFVLDTRGGYIVRRVTSTSANALNITCDNPAFGTSESRPFKKLGAIGQVVGKVGRA